MLLHQFPLDEQNLTMSLLCGWEENHATNAVHLVKNQKAAYKSFCNTTGFIQVTILTILK